MEDLMNFAVFILQAVMWYFAFKSLLALWGAYSVFKEAKELEDEMHSELTKLVHIVKPEIHANVHYWFDEDTDRFLAQGKDIPEICSHLRERFTKDIFLVNGKVLLAGPEFEPMDISNSTPDQVGKFVADKIADKVLPKRVAE
jgi:hypothetical protein